MQALGQFAGNAARRSLGTRTDSVAVSMGATPVETRPDGSKVYEGAASFGDVVKRYPDLKPPRNEFIPADEAMSPEALRLLEGLRFTAGTRSRDWDGKITLAADHTPDLDDRDGEAIEGVVLKGWRHDSLTPGEPPELRVRVLVYTRAAQELLENGVRDLSFGFRTDEERKDGVHQGVPYSVIQRNIRYYHLALVTSARSRTPSGRRARFDSYPSTTRRPATPTRPHVRTPMQRSHLLLATLAVLSGQTPPAAPAMVPATDDKGAPRLDADGAPMMVYDAAAGPVLSEADAALLKQMSPEAQAALGAALGGAVAADETAGDEMEGEAEESAEVAADEEQDAAMLAPVLAKVDAIIAALEAAGIKVGAAKGDEMPPAATKMDALVLDHLIRTPMPAGAKSGALMSALIAAGADAKVAEAGVKNFLKALRKDSAHVTTPTSAIKPIDPAAVIAAAAAAAEAAASKRFDASAAFVQVVRNDHADVATVEQAATVMLTTIKAHLPMLATIAEDHVKAQRLDSLTPLYAQAESIRRDSLLTAQGQGLARLLASTPTGNDGGNVIRAPGRS